MVVTIMRSRWKHRGINRKQGNSDRELVGKEVPVEVGRQVNSSRMGQLVRDIANTCWRVGDIYTITMAPDWPMPNHTDQIEQFCPLLKISRSSRCIPTD